MYLRGGMRGLGVSVTPGPIALRNNIAVVRPTTPIYAPVAPKPVTLAPAPMPAAPTPIQPVGPIYYTRPPIAPVAAPTPAPIALRNNIAVVPSTPIYAPIATPKPVTLAPAPTPSPIQPVGPIYYPRPPIAPPPTLVPIATAGTPVPPGYPTSQIFVNMDGSFWQYSPAQGRWMNVGTPYGTGATPASPVATTTTSPNATGSAYTTPVPANYPTSQPYYDANGNIWTYSSITGQWSVTGSAYTGGAGIPTTAPAPTSTVTLPASADTGYQAILDWFNQTDLLGNLGIAGIPNWIVAAGAAALAFKMSQPSGGRR